jgi:hypothetical protein
MLIRQEAGIHAGVREITPYMQRLDVDYLHYLIY